jgi:hypothetical protein
MIYYRAMPIESEGIRTGDYLTPSLEFAINHALTTSVYHSEDYGVFLVSLDKGEVKEAYNPGEWLYTGRGKKARLIGIAKYNHRRNDSEYQSRSLRSLSGNNKTITTEGKMRKIAADRNYRMLKRANEEDPEESMSIYDWEEANPQPQFDETEFESEMEQYELDPGFKRRVDNWAVQRAYFEERGFSSAIEVLKERVQNAHTLEEISSITAQIKRMMERRNASRGYINRIQDNMRTEDYDAMPAWRQQEVDHMNRQQDLYNKYRNEY